MAEFAECNVYVSKPKKRKDGKGQLCWYCVGFSICCARHVLFVSFVSNVCKRVSAKGMRVCNQQNRERKDCALGGRVQRVWVCVCVCVQSLVAGGRGEGESGKAEAPGARRPGWNAWMVTGWDLLRDGEVWAGVRSRAVCLLSCEAKANAELRGYKASFFCLLYLCLHGHQINHLSCRSACVGTWEATCFVTFVKLGGGLEIVCFRKFYSWLDFACFCWAGHTASFTYPLTDRLFKRLTSELFDISPKTKIEKKGSNI